MSGNPYQTRPAMTAIAIGYSNQSYIADRVLPRVSVDDLNFKFTVFDVKSSFALPNNVIGRKGVANELEYGSSLADGTCEQYGLKSTIPNIDRKQNAQAKLPDPVLRAVAKLTEAHHRIREHRVALIAQDTANYAHAVTLSGTNKLSHTDTDAVGVIRDALDAPLVRPNVMSLGQGDWGKLRSLPEIVSACQGNSGDKGMVSRRAFMDLFELDEINVGAGIVDIAKPGKPANFQRAWGGAISFTHKAPLIDQQDTITWGFTGQYGTWETGERKIGKGDAGLYGATQVFVGEAVGEVICVKDAGYLFKSPF